MSRSTPSTARIGPKALATPRSRISGWSGVDGEDPIDFDGRASGQRRDPDRGASVGAALAEHLVHEIRGAVDHLRHPIEAGRNVDVADHLDDALDAILRNLGVKTLFIGGVNLDQCVMTTLEDASFLGYDTVLVEDGAATTSPDYCVQAAVYNVRLLFGFTTRSEAVLAGLRAG